MRVFKVKIRQGWAHITANSRKHAEAQARELERDINCYWVRAQTMVKPGLFALGIAAKQKLGLEVYSCGS